MDIGSPVPACAKGTTDLPALRSSSFGIPPFELLLAVGRRLALFFIPISAAVGRDRTPLVGSNANAIDGVDALSMQGVFLLLPIRPYELTLRRSSLLYPSARTWVRGCFGAYHLCERIVLLKPALHAAPFLWGPTLGGVVCPARRPLSVRRS